MLVKIYEDNPNQKEIKRVVEVLKNGGVIIYPTDTVYGMGCAIDKPKAVEQVAKLRGIKLEKAQFSFICYDISNISEYVKPLSNDVFKLMKRNLPGPFTFILEAGNNVPKVTKQRKKTVGVRVPDNNIIREIVKELGCPILSTSIHDEDDILEYTTDPELIYEKYENLVDIVIDGGYGDNTASTVVDCTGDEIEIIREGKGELI